jgi:SAM-dependent methyltransferase
VRSLQPPAAVEGITLDVAPSIYLSPLIRELAPTRYLAMDFDPAADGRHVDITASITDVPLPSGSVRMLVCYHVLEHVPDDVSAIAEIRRVLAPGGIGLVQVPWRPGETDEDPSAPPDERIRRFGQADHVRWYGEDFVERLRSGGLHVLELTPDQMLPPSALHLVGAVGGERTWLCTSDESALPTMSGVRDGIVDALAAVVAEGLGTAVASEERVHDAERRAVIATDKAAEWRGRYKTLRGRFPVRVVTAVSRPFHRTSSGA